MQFTFDFAHALKQIRKSRGLTQEDFAELSSRTYVSSLERGIKSPTLSKINELAETLRVHPLTLLAAAYAPDGDLEKAEVTFEAVRRELNEIADEFRASGNKGPTGTKGD